MRLIDADALAGMLDVEYERKMKLVQNGETHLNTLAEGIMSMSVVLGTMPTVDAVEVVRCEKCLYRSQYSDESGHYKCGGLLTEDEELLLMVKPDFYCAYGERRGAEDG